MSNILILPDSFKGSIDTQTFCDIATTAIKDISSNSKVDSYAISDGGDGSLTTLNKLLGGKILQGKVTDSNFFSQMASYGVGDDFAIIEISSCAGLSKCLIRNPLYTTTFGVGEQIKLAKMLNKKNIYLCLGGSSTNDAGAGILCALGAKFYNEDIKEFVPVGNTLGQVCKMDLDEFYKNTDGINLIGLCDVNNPLLGDKGCSYIYAKQKGANDTEVQLLEENMQKWASVTEFLGVDAQLSGNGAAGGIGYMVSAFFGGKLISGIDFVLDKINFAEIVGNYNYIITGEGQFDTTSIMGKVVGGILKRNSNKNAKVVVVCGKNKFNEDIGSKGIYSVIELNDKNKNLQENMANTDKNLNEAIRSFAKRENL